MGVQIVAAPWREDLLLQVSRPWSRPSAGATVARRSTDENVARDHTVTVLCSTYWASPTAPYSRPIPLAL